MDEFQRDRDPVKRRGAAVLGLVVVVVVAALAATLWLTRGRSQSTGAVSPGATTSAPAFATPPSLRPSPVPSQPVVGVGFSAVDDPDAHQLVLVGGIDSYGTTWLWDGRRWSLARPPVSPPGRFGAAAAYDPLTRAVMLYGGRLGPGDAVDDTWAWDGRTWRWLDGGSGNPPRGEGSVMAWDSTTNQMVLVAHSEGSSGGQTWTWEGSRWVRETGGDLPADVSFVGMAVDPAMRTLIGASCCLSADGSTSTWAWNGTVWRQLSAGVQPTFTVGLALDPAGGTLVLLGAPAFVADRQMWSWNGRVWTLVPGVHLPAFPAAAVTDSSDGHLVILGSLAEPVQGTPQPLHIWSWAGSIWTQRG